MAEAGGEAGVAEPGETGVAELGETGVAGADLELAVGGRPLRFPAVWLRDNCPCERCVAPGTGQKLTDITDIPNGVAITHTEDAGESVVVTFAPDQHRSVFPRSWLAEHAPDADGDGRTEDDKDLWLPADLDQGTRLPEMSWPRYLGEGRPGPWRRCSAPFRYIDKETELRASLPLIELSPRGRVRGIRFNNRSARPLRLPYAEVTAFYAAYRRLAGLLAQPGRRLNLRLAPGDCLVFDNTRILHARTAFSMPAGSPGRHLQGCYADLDGLASTLAVLRRTEEP